ncbi:PqqD family protein [Isoptericola sp. NPDC019693]|uniref:PqqD family protein n=1 Tax=Isoptericola sp. NPDC019693 TaxID=3364009 RepID=UPI00379EE26E
MRLRENGVTWQEIDGELVILDLVSSTYLTTNGSGAFTAKLLQEDRTPDDLADALVAEYGIPADVAQRDAGAFVDALRDRGLLVEG